MTIDDLLGFLGSAFTFKGRGYTGDDGSAAGSSAHSGIDLPAAKGTPVRAITTGQVVYARDATGDPAAGGAHAIGGGNVVNIQDELGTFQYAHLDSISVAPGTTVYKGQIIGTVGNTGPFTSGPHLHLGRKEGGSWIDPLTAHLPGGGIKAEDLKATYTAEQWNAAISCMSSGGVAPSSRSGTSGIKESDFPTIRQCASAVGIDLSAVDLAPYLGGSLSNLRDGLAASGAIPGADLGKGIVPDVAGALGDLGELFAKATTYLLAVGLIVAGIWLYARSQRQEVQPVGYAG